MSAGSARSGRSVAGEAEEVPGVVDELVDGMVLPNTEVAPWSMPMK